ncbi:hypothetical protein LZ575_03045 [Antarcticibacterium sp. 1MA-6-2]|uniref:hypothetical protein n=1 Tax=Antarcticibacterium sp. 1MA-6-2 TaxID=2908210 RepID=UPI001F1A0396|nr:hypothetical protein [Antarcticibacterium sp. 1MA-6-2]UJH91679.1 hypothetical protein LZ575_03045 [Antarcticibacterium sp. 1MA-6-2]
MPPEIINALKNAIDSSTGTIEDTKWRDKLAARFSKRWNQRINKLAEEGKEKILPGQTINLFTITEQPGEDKPRSKTSSFTTRQEDKSLNAGFTASGEEKAKETHVPRGIPNYRWVNEEELELGVAAAWEPPNANEPSGVVLLNRGFEMFGEVIRYWQNLYPEHLAEKIEFVVQEIYGQAMVARIAHSESLARNANWGRKAVDNELRSPSSLTMAVLGLVTEDYIIANKLGALLSKRQSS